MHEGISGFKSSHEKLLEAGLDVFGEKRRQHLAGEFQEALVKPRELA